MNPHAPGPCHVKTFRVSSRQKRFFAIFLAVACFALSGCGLGPRRVKVDFTGYEASYATTSNHEVLLNLARLAQHDPTYFFKLGQISSSYRMQAGFSGTGQYVPQGATTGVEVPSGGGTPTAIYENDPAFSFIPVSDEANAHLLLTPVPEDVFYSLYQQGWRVDQLFRLMVDRIEITMPPVPGQTGCRVEVIRNVPPPAYDARDNYQHSQRILSRYVTFLRVSAIVYELQKHGLLQLGGPNAFVPLDRQSGLGSDQAPRAKDMVSAASNNEVWEWNKKDQDWLLGKKVERPRFELSSLSPEEVRAEQAAGGKPEAEIEAVYGQHVEREESFLNRLIQGNEAAGIAGDPSLREFKSEMPVQPGVPELTDILEILYQGFAIGGSPSERDNGEDSGSGPCVGEAAASQPSQPGTPGASSFPPQTAAAAASPGPPSSGKAKQGSAERRVSCRLVMRSLLGLMATAAQEEEAFDTLTQVNPEVRLELREPGPNGQQAQDGLTCAIHRILDGGAEGNQPIDQACKLSGSMEARFNNLVPTVERLPVLRLSWQKPRYPADAHNIFPPPKEGENAESLKKTGLALMYKDQHYWITDFDVAAAETPAPATADSQDWAEENQYWNRDMFRLIVQLSSQVTVDISKFPLPEILQLRTE